MFCPLSGKQCDSVKNIHIISDITPSGVNQMFVCSGCSGYFDGIALMENKKPNHLDLVKKQQDSLHRPCPSCGLTLTEFAHTGKTGCANCYDFFQRQLSKVISHAQNGKVHHEGKIPKKIPQQQLTRLQHKMDEAIKVENYEVAAKIRDQINLVKNKFNL